MPRVSDKRDRLLQAGRQLIHRQGVRQTTLADVAHESGVPLGNVYYYFKTKDALVDAVAERLSDDFLARARSFEREPDPRRRLLAFLDAVVANRETFAAHGCPVGSLSQELNKDTQATARERVNRALVVRAEWAATQFRAMGRRDAQELGVRLIACVQGVILMANALREAGVISRQVRELKRWIESIDAAGSGA